MDLARSRLLIVSDDQLLLDCLGLVLHGVNGSTVEALAGNSAQALQALARSSIDQVLIRMELPRAVELAREIEEHAAGVRVVIAGVPVDESDILECVRAGAAGITSDRSGYKALIEAVTWGGDRELLLCSETTTFVLSRLQELAEQRGREAQADCLVNLSFREIEILRKLASGLTNKEIANQLVLSLYTVKNHVHNILRKLQVGSRAEAVAYATQRGWVPNR